MRLSLVAALLAALCACSDLDAWQDDFKDAMSSVDLDGDGWSVDAGDCNEDCDQQLRGPDGYAVCLGWYFSPGLDLVATPELWVGPGLDQDCDGSIDDTSGADLDGDGWTFADNDCDDLDSSVHPGASETCDDHVDQNCDGLDAACWGQ